MPAPKRALSFQDLAIAGARLNAQNTGKQAAAHAALEFVAAGKVLGVGTGTTVNFLIDELSAHGIKLAGAVSSSTAGRPE